MSASVHQARGITMRFIGITGGVGAGKTEIVNYLRRHYKCEIYLADRIAEQLQEPGNACFHALISLLGEEIMTPDGRLDRGLMAEKIFADPEVLLQVNGIVHPAVRDFLSDRLKRAEESGEVELFFVEAALLIEAGYRTLVDELWYVYADETVRRERLSLSRGYSEDKISRIMASQLEEEAFRNNCDFIIDNSGSLEESYKQIDRKLEAFTWQE